MPMVSFDTPWMFSRTLEREQWYAMASEDLETKVVTFFIDTITSFSLDSEDVSFLESFLFIW